MIRVTAITVYPQFYANGMREIPHRPAFSVWGATELDVNDTPNRVTRQMRTQVKLREEFPSPSGKGF